MNEQELVAAINEANEAFDAMCIERHTMGAEKYGSATWLTVNTVEMALEEVVDLANYARYTFAKLWLLNKYADEKLAQQEVSIGAHAFDSNSKPGGGS